MDNSVDVLVIDDNRHQLNFITRLLNSRGLRTQALEKSKNALSIIQKIKPKLIILDILMPSIDGFTILKRIRANTSFGNIPVIVYTGKTFDVDKRKALSLGANTFLPKPSRSSVLMTEVEKYI